MEFKLEHEKLLILEDNRVVGRLLYLETTPNIVNILSVHVNETHRGLGIAGQLMNHFTAYVKETGKKVIPTCSYAQSYYQKHPEEDLMA